MHAFTHHHHSELDETRKQPVETRGLVMNWGWPYDLMVRFFDNIMFHGTLHALPKKTVDLAQLRPGETVLDVGCGTGTLALVAKERVGATGRVYGIDPGPKQLAQARLKAVKAGLAIDFQQGVIEQLAFPDQSFDVVLSTLMMHHLPDDLKRQGLSEIVRVLKPGGRLVVVDFKRPEKHHDQPAKFGAGTLGIQDMPALMNALGEYIQEQEQQAALMKEAGFTQIEAGEIENKKTLFPAPEIGFVRARIGS
jgi:ubiquinone/menaquinone biosynthesis C-methylase UbiE